MEQMLRKATGREQAIPGSRGGLQLAMPWVKRLIFLELTSCHPLVPDVKHGKVGTNLSLLSFGPAFWFHCFLYSKSSLLEWECLPHVIISLEPVMPFLNFTGLYS